jgi:pimeloyl-ACP methyl ester carboxylesterase
VPAVAGLASAYPELALGDVLTPGALDALDVVETGCLVSFSSAFGSVPGGVRLADPMSRADWKARVEENDAGARIIGAPVLVVQGGRDTTVAPELTSVYVRLACSTGTDAALSMFPAANHLSITGGEPRTAMLDWIADRVARRPVEKRC